MIITYLIRFGCACLAIWGIWHGKSEILSIATHQEAVAKAAMLWCTKTPQCVSTVSDGTLSNPSLRIILQPAKEITPENVEARLRAAKVFDAKGTDTAYTNGKAFLVIATVERKGQKL